MRGPFVVELLDAGQVAAYDDVRVRLLNPHLPGIRVLMVETSNLLPMEYQVPKNSNSTAYLISPLREGICYYQRQQRICV